MVTFYDHRNRPIRSRELTREVAAPSITGVRSIYSSHPASRLTPERMASILREAETPGGAAEYLELAEEMEELHPHYLGVLQTRRRQVSQLPVEVVPASDSRSDADIADEVRAWFAREVWEDEAADVLDAIGKGFSCSEIVWEHSERQWSPSRLLHRLPQHFDFDRDTGAVLRMRAEGGEGGWADLPPWKFVLHQVGAKSGLPIRGGIARVAAWTWMFAVYGQRDWARYVEAYGMPIRLGRYHHGATDEEIAVLRRAVRDLAADAAAVLPEEMSIEFVGAETGSGTGAEVYGELQRHLDAQLSVAVLGQTLTTEPGQSGSYSLGQVHDRVRADIARSDGRQLAATLRRDLVIPMVALNHGPDAAAPTLRIQRREAVDADSLSQALERLVPLGLRVRAEQVREMLGFAAPAGGDEVLAPPRSGIAAARRLSLDDPALPRRGAPDDGIEIAWADALDDWRPMLDPMVAPAVSAAAEMIERGGGLAALRDRLPDLLADMDDSALASALERLAFSARLAGRADPERR